MLKESLALCLLLQGSISTPSKCPAWGKYLHLPRDSGPYQIFYANSVIDGGPCGFCLISGRAGNEVSQSTGQSAMSVWPTSNKISEEEGSGEFLWLIILQLVWHIDTHYYWEKQALPMWLQWERMMGISPPGLCWVLLYVPLAIIDLTVYRSQ